MPTPGVLSATNSPPSWEDTEPFEAPPAWEETSPFVQNAADMDPYDPGAKEPWEMAAEEFSSTVKAQEQAANTPLVPPDALKFLIEHTPNAFTLSKLLPVPESIRHGMEGYKDTLAEGAAGMTSPNSIGMLPAFALPYVGPALAMGLGAKAVGEGAGKTVAAVEQGNPREIGEGLGEVGFGASMAVPGAVGAFRSVRGLLPKPSEVIDVEPVKPTAEAPPIIAEAVKQGEQFGLTKSVEALKATEKGEANASGVTKPESVPELEVRPRVGEEAPLRQQGETAPIQRAAEILPKEEVTQLATDAARFKDLEAQVKQMRETQSPAEVMGSPEYMALATEQQSIKNKYQGHKPGDVAAESTAKAATEVTTKAPSENEPWLVPWADGRARAWFKTKEAAEEFYKQKRAENDVDGPPQQGKPPVGVKYADAKYLSSKGQQQSGMAAGEVPDKTTPPSAPSPSRDAIIIEEYKRAIQSGLERLKEIAQQRKQVRAQFKGVKPISTMNRTTPSIERGQQFQRALDNLDYEESGVRSQIEVARNRLAQAKTPEAPQESGRVAGSPTIPIEPQPREAKGAETPQQAQAESVAIESMGGMRPEERLKAPLAGVTDSLKTLAESEKGSAAEAFDIGKAVAEAKDRVSSAAEGLRAAGEYAKLKLEGKPVVTDWHRTLGQRHLELSESAVNARKFAKESIRAIPDKLTREAISDWIDTGGDPALLTRAAAETKPGYKAGYEKAKALTPEQRTIAENLKNYFEHRLEDAQKAGILEDGIENYIHRLYEKESPFKKAVLAELRSGLFTGQPSLAKQRVFEYDFEAEKAGLKPIKDFVQRVAAYDLALNKAIADRKAVKSMMEIKMPDGRPMIDVGGGGKIIEAPTGETEATIINRSARKIDETNPKANRGDYKPYDHPALRKWKWVLNDAEGKPVFVQGDVLIHPDALRQMESLLGRSRIRANPAGRAALNLSSTIKQTMLDLSGFHQVQIAVHGAEHRTFAPVKEIDFTNPDVRGLIKGGAVVGETTGQHLFSEGLSGSSLTKHIPWAGERIQAYQSYLFEDFIPRVKVAMGLHALERNRARFPNLSEDALYKMTAEQMNAAFGELNYEMLGRSKTVQDALRLTLLAPDFLEARSRFVAQAFTKYGSEQRQALLLGAATMFIFARIANKILDDEYHFEPKNWFNVVYKGKSYGLRTIQGDLIHMVTDPGKFTNHRLNPIYAKPALEFATGRDYFGRKRDAGDKLKDIAMTPVPISVRGLFSGREQSLLESFLNSFGFVTKRNSPASDIAKLATEWREKNKVRPESGEFIYDPEKDPYRKIKLAAEYYDVAAVRSEIERALADGVTKAQIRKHFVLASHHRFTGSAANERKFLESLNADQKDMYRKALAERKKIRETVEQALR